MYRRLQHKFATEREFAAFSGFLQTGTHTKTKTQALALALAETQTQAQAQHTQWIETRSAHAGALTCLSECLSKTDTTTRLSTGHSAAFVRLYPCVCVCFSHSRECRWRWLCVDVARTELATPTPAAMFSSRTEQAVEGFADAQCDRESDKRLVGCSLALLAKQRSGYLYYVYDIWDQHKKKIQLYKS